MSKRRALDFTYTPGMLTPYRALDLTYTPGMLTPYDGSMRTYFARIARLPVELFEYIMRLMNRQLRITYEGPFTWNPWSSRYVTARGYLHPLGRTPRTPPDLGEGIGGIGHMLRSRETQAHRHYMNLMDLGVLPSFED